MKRRTGSENIMPS